MQCPQCQFENIPGQDRCLRCNALLHATGFAVEINPPRMAQWKRPFRDTARWFRLHKIAPEKYPKWIKYLKIMSGNAFTGLILSIVPGFAHLVSGRFTEIFWLFLIWFLAFFAGVYLYGSSVGLALLGLAVGFHCLIAFQHTLLKEHEELLQQLIDFVLLLVLISLVYFSIRIFAFSNYVFGYTNLTIPGQNIQTGDLFLGKRSAIKSKQLHRGDLVLVPVQMSIGGDLGLRRFTAGSMIGQIIGLGDDIIEIRDNNFIVNDQVLPNDKYPLPLWLRGRKPMIIEVPPGFYFVSSEYNIRGDAGIINAIVAEVCLIKTTDIEAKAFMLWFPLDRRGILKEGP